MNQLMKLLYSILKFLGKVTCTTPPFQFSREVHGKAIIKALIAWILVTSPLILTILMSPGPSSASTGILAAIRERFVDIITQDGIYVYCASFLTPFLAIGIGRLIEAIHDKKNQEKSRGDGILMRGIFDGYWFGFIVAIILLALTAFVYSGSVLDPTQFSETILSKITTGYVTIIYFVSLYFWYLAFLDENNTSSDFRNEFRNAEDAASSEFSDRLNN